MNETEAQFEQHCKNRNIKFYRNGWPDYLLDNGKAVYFVEIKGNKNDQLQDSQKIMFAFLKKLGFEVIISVGGEWIEPSVLTNPSRLMALDSDLQYYFFKLKSLKERIASMLYEIEDNLRTLESAERRFDKLKSDMTDRDKSTNGEITIGES